MTLDAAYSGFLPLVRIFFLEKSMALEPWHAVVVADKRGENMKTHEVVPEIDLPRACELSPSRCWRTMARPKSIPFISVTILV